MSDCLAPDCEKPERRRGLCSMHAMRLHRSGRLDLDPKPTYAELLMRKVERTESGCWLWTARTDRDGYGLMKTEGRNSTVRAHRAVYLLLKGEIPDGLHLDHLCRVRNCVNPDHLEPVTPAENVRRSHRALGRRDPATLRPTCANGHAYTPENMTIGSKGERVCRTCHRETQRKYRAGRKRVA